MNGVSGLLQHSYWFFLPETSEYIYIYIVIVKYLAKTIPIKLLHPKLFQ